jgi:hypothetical protein
MLTPNPSNASIPLFSSGSSTPNPPPTTNRKRSDGSSDTFHPISSFTANDEAYFVPQWGPHFYAVPPKRNQGTAASKKRSEKGDIPNFRDGKVRCHHMGEYLILLHVLLTIESLIGTRM